MLNAIFRPQKFTGWHMAIVMGLFFGTIITVNMTLAYYANSSWTGLVVKNSYVASQKFNSETARLEKQQAMGWKISADYNNGIVTLGVNDRVGKALELSELTAKIGRPVTEVDDRYLPLTKLDDGSFQAETTLAKGVWQIDMVASDNQGNTLEKSIRITVNRP